MSVLLLLLTIFLSTIRDAFSKNISELPFGTKNFFFRQFAIFFSGCIVLIVGAVGEKPGISLTTAVLALIYGLLLMATQYGYTYAMKKGNLGICATVYSMGFIFPALSGSIFWNEPINGFNILGIFTVIPAIIISGMSSSKNDDRKNANGYILPLMVAMLASGGLGIMQKVQQKSQYPGESLSFIIISFAFAGMVSLLLSLITKEERKIVLDKKVAVAGGVGAAFGLCNLLNTILAGSLDSAVLFPVLNISRMLFSLVLGIFIFKEKLSKKDYSVLVLGIISIMLLTFK